ncbi:hypothetical protein K0504_09970 [Neiella marina]|uniref:Uncharacterized protein n=1 Tax=Neiella holothuriorum TaxID=2870530 RepID=A0ABS7EG96_9GAMM|nr:hypothetical protein [Neiella holothuriorum]MBW8191364.1 hypothetical protein [Neiella holothuriorum]
MFTTKPYIAPTSVSTELELSSLSYDELDARLEWICSAINERERQYIRAAGPINANSTIAGLANGSLSVTTEIERKETHAIQQQLMSRTGERIAEARARNLARVAARNARIKQRKLNAAKAA